MIVLAILAATLIEDRDVTLHNRVPTRVISILQQAAGPDGPLVPTKLGANADDKKKTVHFRGEAAQLDRVEALLAFFDQPKTNLLVKATIRSRMDRMRNDYILDLENGSAWKMTDSETGLTICLWPLMQDDGSLKIFAQYISGSGTWRTISVIKPREILILRPNGVATSKPMGADLSGVPLKWWTVPEIKGDALKWYITEGPEPKLTLDKTTTVDSIADPVFSATFEPKPT